MSDDLNNGGRETRRQGGILAKLGEGPVTGRLDSLAIEARHRLNAIEEHLARIANQQERAALRGEAISRAEQSPNAAGGQVDLTIGPRPGSVWVTEAIVPRVVPCAADRVVTLFLGDIGDTSRPLGLCFAKGGGGFPGDVGTYATPTFLVRPLTITRPIYCQFAGLAAGEIASVHVVARELAPTGEVGGS